MCASRQSTISIPPEVETGEEEVESSFVVLPVVSTVVVVSEPHSNQSI